MTPLPSQNPWLITSCEYDSFVMGSAFGLSGAGRPENRVDARSKLPQKKCTGLDLPMNLQRKASNPGLMLIRMLQNPFADSGLYEWWITSLSNRMGSGISTGIAGHRAVFSIAFRAESAG